MAKRGLKIGVRITLKGAEKEKRDTMGIVPKKAKRETQKDRNKRSLLGGSLKDKSKYIVAQKDSQKE